MPQRQSEHNGNLLFPIFIDSQYNLELGFQPTNHGTWEEKNLFGIIEGLSALTIDENAFDNNNKTNVPMEQDEICDEQEHIVSAAEESPHNNGDYIVSAVEESSYSNNETNVSVDDDSSEFSIKFEDSSCGYVSETQQVNNDDIGDFEIVDHFDSNKVGISISPDYNPTLKNHLNEVAVNISPVCTDDLVTEIFNKNLNDDCQACDSKKSTILVKRGLERKKFQGTINTVKSNKNIKRKLDSSDEMSHLYIASTSDQLVPTSKGSPPKKVHFEKPEVVKANPSVPAEWTSDHIEMLTQFESERKSALFTMLDNKPGDRNIAWHFSVPYQLYNTDFIKRLQYVARYYTGQEEITSDGYHHFQVYLETKNEEYSGIICKKLGVSFVKSVQYSKRHEIIRYVTKLEIRIKNGLLLQFGDLGKKGKKRKLQADGYIWTKSIESGNLKAALDIIRKEEPEKYLCKKKIIRENLLSEFGFITSKKYTTNFNRPFMTFTNGRTKILVGKTGLGKTNYALAHFKSPTLITSRQQFGQVNDDCTGMVIDNVQLSSMTANDVLHLFDTRQTTTVNIKNGYGIIPQGLPRIVTCNLLKTVINEAWDQDIKDAILNRCDLLDISSKLYNDIPKDPNECVMKNMYTDINEQYQNETIHFINNN